MGGVLKVCRLGQMWAVKDESGAFWDVTPDRETAENAAAKRAKPASMHVVVRDEQGVQR